MTFCWETLFEVEIDWPRLLVGRRWRSLLSSLNPWLFISVECSSGRWIPPRSSSRSNLYHSTPQVIHPSPEPAGMTSFLAVSLPPDSCPEKTGEFLSVPIGSRKVRLETDWKITGIVRKHPTGIRRQRTSRKRLGNGRKRRKPAESDTEIAGTGRLFEVPATGLIDLGIVDQQRDRTDERRSNASAIGSDTQEDNGEPSLSSFECVSFFSSRDWRSSLSLCLDNSSSSAFVGCQWTEIEHPSLEIDLLVDSRSSEWRDFSAHLVERTDWIAHSSWFEFSRSSVDCAECHFDQSAVPSSTDLQFPFHQSDPIEMEWESNRDLADRTRFSPSIEHCLLAHLSIRSIRSMIGDFSIHPVSWTNRRSVETRSSPFRSERRECLHDLSR